MAEKILNTRIQLKYDSYAAWQSSNITLKAGEIAIAYLSANGTPATDDTNVEPQQPILAKVGDGSHKFSELPWMSALAADVYAWAKESKLYIDPDHGTGNVVSGIEWDATANGGKGGIKFTTAAVATSEGLQEVQNDIANNRDAWAKDDNTTYTFAESTDGKGIVITPSEGNAKTISFAFLTQAEIDALNHLVAADITTGSANGTIAVEGTDVAVKGLQDAAYTTVASLNATAKDYADAVEAKLPTPVDYGVLSVAKGDNTITIGGTAQNPTIKVTENTFDAHGAATAVLGNSGDAATANTVYGAKAAAAAAQNDATIAKTKIETFLGTVTPDGSQDIIDTLAEINTYVGEHGKEFAALSAKVTKIEDGTTTVPKATDADTVDGKHASDFATAAQGELAESAVQRIEFVEGASLNGTYEGNGGVHGVNVDNKTLFAFRSSDTLNYSGVWDENAENLNFVSFDIKDKGISKQKLDEDLYNYIENKVDKIPGASDGKIVLATQDGGIRESGYFITDIATKEQGAKADTALQTASGLVDIAPTVEGTNLKFWEIRISKDGTAVKLEKGADNYVDLAGIKVNNAGHADTVADHAVGAHQTKACADYSGDDAEVWVFNCGSASVNV